MAVGSFGRSWWGAEWVRALESSLDGGRLSRGRSYARNGAVGPMRIGKGFVTAEVEGSDGRSYDTDIAVKRLAEVEWDQVIDAIAARSAHAAALLDGELDPALVADAAEVDVRLLPGPGDLRPDCSCPDWTEPCKHAAALCYTVADELDQDPFQLFLLRGMDRDTLLERVRARRPSGAAVHEPQPVGVSAAEMWARAEVGDALGPVPDVVVVLGSLPERPLGAGFRYSLGGVPGVDVGQLAGLADDAAERAWSMLADGAPSGLRSTSRADLARRARHLSGDRRLANLAASAGIPLARLKAWSEAWELAGDRGVSMVADDDLWSNDQEVLERARASLVDLGHPKRSIGLSWNGLRMKDGVWIVADFHGGWYKLIERGTGRRELHLLAGPADNAVDLVDPPE